MVKLHYNPIKTVFYSNKYNKLGGLLKMRAKDLIGELAIRTQSVGMDRSFTESPIRILTVTDNHIVYDHIGTPEDFFEDKIFILNKDWNDNNWIDYNELIRMVNATKRRIDNVTVNQLNEEDAFSEINEQ
jgi:hypothetical protein